MASIWPGAMLQRTLAADPCVCKGMGIGRARAVNVGEELTRGLLAYRRFGFRSVTDAATARQAGRRGELAFAMESADGSGRTLQDLRDGIGPLRAGLQRPRTELAIGVRARVRLSRCHRVAGRLNP